jgi:hypothetical protein
MSFQMTNQQKLALERLIIIAHSDTGQSRIIANFLLAWWNAAECGGFDLTDLWGLDEPIRVDMVVLFIMLAGHQHYPDTLGYTRDFGRIIDQWRPELRVKKNLFDSKRTASQPASQAGAR